jgi:hypothetical protein
MNEHQQTKTFSADDHRLTAYALGELSGAERAEVEAMLKNDPEARAAVEEIRALAEKIEGALEAEALAEPVINADGGSLSKETKGAKVLLRAEAGGAEDPYRKKIVRFPYVWVGTLAAACFAVVFAVRENPQTTVTAHHAAEDRAKQVMAETLESEGGAAVPVEAAAGVFLVKDADEAARLTASGTRGGDAGSDDTVAGSDHAGVAAAGDFARVQSAPLSSFAAEVDTESYLKVRRYLDQGRLPPRDAVRVEEMVNYFNYRYSTPAKEPFAASMEIATAPWNPAHRLVRIGVKGREAASEGQTGGGTAPIAKEVKLQVEFNPAVAQAYRLLGYENGASKVENSNNDKPDAGEIGAGHTVTALYEIVPVGAPAPESTAGEAEELKYQKTVLRTEPGEGAAGAGVAVTGTDNAADGGASTSGELLTLKIRFKEPTVDVSRKMEIPVIDTGAAFEAASKDFKFAAAVASLGMILRESGHTVASDYDRVISWAEAGKGDDADGKRGEFIELVKKARTLSAE